MPDEQSDKKKERERKVDEESEKTVWEGKEDNEESFTADQSSDEE